ncbi:unnamed protein product, partial [Nesidiocoris tenuis]
MVTFNPNPSDDHQVATSAHHQVASGSASGSSGSGYTHMAILPSDLLLELDESNAPVTMDATSGAMVPQNSGDAESSSGAMVSVPQDSAMVAQSNVTSMASVSVPGPSSEPSSSVGPLDGQIVLAPPHHHRKVFKHRHKVQATSVLGHRRRTADPFSLPTSDEERFNLRRHDTQAAAFDCQVEELTRQFDQSTSNLMDAMSKSMEDMTNSTYLKYKQRSLTVRRPQTLFLFVSSIARTNLEIEVVQRGGSLLAHSQPNPLIPKRSCI